MITFLLAGTEIFVTEPETLALYFRKQVEKRNPEITYRWELNLTAP